MVYLGRPSHGCFTCRARRIKCDEGRPTCKRCEKSKRHCGGYKPEWEHRHDARNARNQNLPTKVPITRNKPIFGTYTFSEEGLLINFVCGEPQRSLLSYQQSASPQRTPTIPIAQRAACHFASNFILLPHDTTTYHTQQGFLSYVIPLIKSEPDNSPIRSAFNACALALMSNLERADNVNLTNLTLKEHTLALGRTHAALGSPTTASLDSTLATVLLLSLFESITAVKETEMLIWRTHLQGAINLVKSRGREQLRSTNLGTTLFNAVRQQLISRTLSEGSAPPMGVEWWMVGSETDLDPVMATSQRLALQTAELRAEVSRTMERVTASPEAGLSSREEIKTLRRRVQFLDSKISGFLHSSSLLPCQTLTWISDTGDARFSGNYAESKVYPGRIDVYPDIISAQLWNIARVSRLILASINIRLMAWLHSSFLSPAGGDYRDAPEYMITRQICEGIILDIIASVPVLLGWRPPPGLSFHHEHLPSCSADCTCTDSDALQTVTGQSRIGFACGNDAQTTEPPIMDGSIHGKTKALAGMFLTWPLLSIKNHDFCSPTQREWVSGRLKYIDRHAGLRYAGVVNQVPFRYPSMLIRRDGGAVMPTPMPGEKGMPLRRGRE